MMVSRAVACVSILITGCAAPTPRNPQPTPRLTDYAGVYSSGPLLPLTIGSVDDLISAVPPFWGSKPYFRRVRGEIFAMARPYPAPHRTLTFERGPDRSVVGVRLAGVDERCDGQEFTRVAVGTTTPALLFLARRPAAAAAAALADKSIEVADLCAFARNHLAAYPSRHADTAAFLAAVARARPNAVCIQSMLGTALIAAGDRAAAATAFARALALDPTDEQARDGARRLAAKEPAPGQGYRAVLPYRLADAFAPPTGGEIRAVRAAWARRDLSARDVEVVDSYDTTFAGTTFTVSVLRHRGVAGIHYGAVYTPKHTTGPLPVVLDLRGVDLHYSPLDLSEPSETLVALGSSAAHFVIAAPSYRGNLLLAHGHHYHSAGDPSDAWDGATDDALAFLSATLATTPQADPNRIAAVGKSRGGTVAMLAGERDHRIGVVFSISGPVDQFQAQDPHIGWSWAELLAFDMADGKPPSLTDDSGQKFDQFFDRGEALGQVRQRMLASSPLYFAEALPETHAFYGAEDTAVPIANSRALRARLAPTGRLGRDITATVFEGRGHDTDPYLVQRALARRLAAWASARSLATSAPLTGSARPSTRSTPTGCREAAKSCATSRASCTTSSACPRSPSTSKSPTSTCR